MQERLVYRLPYHVGRAFHFPFLLFPFRLFFRFVPFSLFPTVCFALQSVGSKKGSPCLGLTGPAVAGDQVLGQSLLAAQVRHYNE